MFQPFDFPQPFDSNNAESIKCYYDALKNQREQALKKPLTTNLTLELNLVCKAKPSPASRPLPWFAKNEGTYSCKLLEPLQEGPDKYSQVWIARVLPSEGTTPSEEVKIVLKFIQPSLSFLPNPNECWEVKYINPEKLARNEDLAYSELINIQGIYVPYYYGMQEITSPSVERVWVLAMEYIDGVNIAKLVHDVRVEDRLSNNKSLKPENIDTFCKVYLSMAETTIAIMNADVRLLDKRTQNFVFCRKSERVVGIDFARVGFGYGGDDDKQIEFNDVAGKFLDRFGPYMAPVHDRVETYMLEGERGFARIGPDDNGEE